MGESRSEFEGWVVTRMGDAGAVRDLLFAYGTLQPGRATDGFTRLWYVSLATAPIDLW